MPPLIEKSYAPLWTQSWERDCGILKSDEVLVRDAPMESCNKSAKLTFRGGSDPDLVVEDKTGEKTWSLKRKLANEAADAVVNAVNDVAVYVPISEANKVKDKVRGALEALPENTTSSQVATAIGGAVQFELPTINVSAIVGKTAVKDKIDEVTAVLSGHHMRMQEGGLFAIEDASDALLLSVGGGLGIPGAELLLQRDGNVCTSEQTGTQDRWCTNSGWCRAFGETLLMGDVNGDGFDDLICHDSNGIRFDYADPNDINGLSGTDAVYPNTDPNIDPGSADLVPWCVMSGERLLLGDVNGDGKDDMVCDANGVIWIDDVWDDIGIHSWTIEGWCVLPGERVLLGDVDGDGADELVCHGGPTTWIRHISDPGTPDEMYPAWCASEDFKLIDLDWDGRDDFLCVNQVSGIIDHDYAANGFGATDRSGAGLEPGVQFAWSSAGEVPGMDYCTQITESAEPAAYTWNDNYFCSSHDVGMEWSSAGEIPGMKCTQINEPSDPHTWTDNYLCLPESSRINFSWSFASLRGPRDVQWHEDAVPAAYTWSDNFLTVHHP